jgi:hypothetical protein
MEEITDQNLSLLIAGVQVEKQAAELQQGIKTSLPNNLSTGSISPLSMLLNFSA